MSAPTTHQHRVTVAAAPAVVYDALTRSDALASWFAEHAAVDPSVGGRFHCWGQHTPGCPAGPAPDDHVLEAEPGVRLRVRWRFLNVPSTVTFAFVTEGEGTALTLTHELDHPLGMPRAAEYLDDWWRLALGNLDAWLQGGAGLCRVAFGDPSPEVRLSLEIAAPRAAVFQALLDPAIVNQWLAKAATIEPCVGGRYDLGWSYEVDGRTVVGGTTRILELVPDERLVLDWLDWRGDATVTGQTIAFMLADAPGNRTRLEFVHGGFQRAVDVSDYPFGWRYFLEKLVSVAT